MNRYQEWVDRCVHVASGIAFDIVTRDDGTRVLQARCSACGERPIRLSLQSWALVLRTWYFLNHGLIPS